MLLPELKRHLKRRTTLFRKKGPKFLHMKVMCRTLIYTTTNFYEMLCCSVTSNSNNNIRLFFWFLCDFMDINSNCLGNLIFIIQITVREFYSTKVVMYEKHMR